MVFLHVLLIINLKDGNESNVIPGLRAFGLCRVAQVLLTTRNDSDGNTLSLYPDSFT